MSVHLSVRPHGTPRLQLDGFSWNLIFDDFSKIRRENSNFHLNLKRITGTLHEYLCTFMIISRWILLRMRNVSHKSCRVNQNTHFMFNNSFPETRAVYEIKWKNTVQPDRPKMTILYGACALHVGYLRLQTHSEYLILIAFPRQQRLRERASLLLYTYIACLVSFDVVLNGLIFM
jgi:hypothetical protein